MRTQLCLAVAALAAHLPAVQWGPSGVVGWLVQRLGGEPQAVSLPCMLELLTVLPQVGAAPRVPALSPGPSLRHAACAAGPLLPGHLLPPSPPYYRRCGRPSAWQGACLLASLPGLPAGPPPACLFAHSSMWRVVDSASPA